MVVKAVDRDEGKNGYIEYILDGETSVPFTLGPVDGLLRVSGKLDREMKTSYMLNVLISSISGIYLIANLKDETSTKAWKYLLDGRVFSDFIYV